MKDDSSPAAQSSCCVLLHLVGVVLPQCLNTSWTLTVKARWLAQWGVQQGRGTLSFIFQQFLGHPKFRGFSSLIFHAGTWLASFAKDSTATMLRRWPVCQMAVNWCRKMTRFGVIHHSKDKKKTWLSRSLFKVHFSSWSMIGISNAKLNSLYGCPCSLKLGVKQR